MIKIRYEYVCDICKGEIRPVQEYTCTPLPFQPNIACPQPSVTPHEYFHPNHLCPTCMGSIYKAYRARIKEIYPGSNL